MKQFAARRNRKDSAMGGMIMGVRRKLEEKEEESSEKDGMIWKIVRLGGEKWKIIGVYVRGG